MFYEEIFRGLNRAKIKYIIAGGIAVNLHGIPRATGDLDLLIALDERNIIKFSKAMTRLGYRPKAPVNIEDFSVKKNREKWANEKGMKVFSLWNKKMPYKIVDVFVENPIGFRKLYSDRVDISVGRFTIPVVSIRHLIELKKKAGRKQDISDIELLKRVRSLAGKRI
ncbi:MAG: nucleotidyltransferase [Candidatus Omnitrophica bacterium]|nr:nucleotidyltransferase [Candidatus Omnitrophota bacterium]